MQFLDDILVIGGEDRPVRSEMYMALGSSQTLTFLLALPALQALQLSGGG